MVGMNEARSTAPWLQRQLTVLLAQRGHAWLLHGPSGLGQYTLALDLARAWLCERPASNGACGQCGSCHAIAVRTHADLCVLMPETVMQQRQWPLGEKAQSEIDDKKRKPSREIRVDAMREAIEFSQRTSGWGRGKVVLVYPPERMNGVTANALLKTLEEPPGDVKFVLASEAAQQLLPTIRSRCLGHAMAWPGEAELAPWLAQHGMDAEAAAVWLRAAGGRPDDALALGASGMDARHWSALPRLVQRGEIGAMQGRSPAEVVVTLHKLCHDMQLHAIGARPRFFDARDLPAPASFAGLSAWGRALARTTRTMEHPFNAGLMVEALLSQAKNALNSRH